jgi:glucose/arabinose dehydrogenase
MVGMGRAPLAAAALVMMLAPAACSGGDPASSAPRATGAPDPGNPGNPGNTAITAPTPTATPPGSTGPGTSPRAARAQVAGVVARNLAVPWGLDFLPDGSALVTERDRATIRRVTPAGQVSTVGSVAGVVPTSEGGLLGLAVSPSYRRDHRVYVYLTTARDNRVVSLTYRPGQGLGNRREIITGIPFGDIHDGGRLEFGPDGRLYVSTGETGDEDLAQDMGSPAGKILRLNPDGSVPAGNPIAGSPVWTSGHRNVQGLAFDARGRLWATEFGSDVWDELNRIVRGRDYGWPAAEGDANLPDYTDPLVQWRPDNASPSGLAFASGSLWAASLNGERLWQIPVRPDGGVRRPRPLFVGDYGRLRTVEAAPDGSLWVTTSNRDGRGDPAPDDDRILRLTLD